MTATGRMIFSFLASVFAYILVFGIAAGIIYSFAQKSPWMICVSFLAPIAAQAVSLGLALIIVGKNPENSPLDLFPSILLLFCVSVISILIFPDTIRITYNSLLGDGEQAVELASIHAAQVAALLFLALVLVFFIWRAIRRFRAKEKAQPENLIK